MTFKSKVLNANASAFLKIGADKVYLKLIRPKSMILCYHGVTKFDYSGFPARHLPFDNFKKQIEYLKTRFQILPITEICEMKKNGIRPKRPTIGLTFDDGCRNNFTEVIPFLKSENIPATFFISTIGLHQDNEDRIQPSYRIDVINGCCPLKKIQLAGNEYERRGKLYFNMNSEKSIYDDLIAMTQTEQLELLKELKTNTDFSELLKKTNPDFYTLATGEELRNAAAGNLIELGGHTYSHINLTEAEVSDFRLQLQESKEKLEKLIGKETVSFAYPFGASNEEVYRQTLLAGYKNIFSLESLHENREKDFPRFCVSHTTSDVSNISRMLSQIPKLGF